MSDDDLAARLQRADAIWRSAFRWGLAAALIAVAVSVYYARLVWPLAHAPMHFDMAGHVNRWGSGRAAATVLLAPPLLSLGLVVLFRMVSKTGPRRGGLAATPRLFAAAMIGVPVFMAFIAFVVGSSMIAGEAGNPGAQAPFVGPRAIIVACCAMIVGLGNFLGKTRPNWWLGVRTPWSLTSDLAWAKSNRLAGRLMVATGLAAGASALFATVAVAVLVLTVGTLVMAVASVYVSWASWRKDPNRAP